MLLVRMFGKRRGRGRVGVRPLRRASATVSLAAVLALMMASATAATAAAVAPLRTSPHHQALVAPAPGATTAPAASAASDAGSGPAGPPVTTGPNEPVAKPLKGRSSGPANSAYSLNWSGIAETGTTFTSVSGDWTVPSVLPSSSPQYSATWVGLDGYLPESPANESLIQTGTAQDTAYGTTSYSAWYELIPANPVTIPQLVAPGDQMAATISQQSASTWLISLQDHTAGWSFSQTVTYTTPGASAEWIEEAPSLGEDEISSLADFGSTTFTSVAATGQDPATVVQNPIQMVGFEGDTLAWPGSFDTATDSFTITYGPVPTGQPSIPTTLLPPGAVGVPYDEQLAATGGLAPYTWSTSGLPKGLALDPSTGIISGTPAKTGTTIVDLIVDDASGGQGEQILTLTILRTLPALSLSSDTVATGFEQTGDAIPLTYLVTDTGGTALSDVSVASTLVGSPSCPDTTLAPGASEVCSAVYFATSTDVSNELVNDSAVASGDPAGGPAVSSNAATLTVTEDGCATPAFTSPTSPTSVTASVGAFFSFTTSVCAQTVTVFSATGLPRGLKVVQGAPLVPPNEAEIEGVPKGGTAGVYRVQILDRVLVVHKRGAVSVKTLETTISLTVQAPPTLAMSPTLAAVVGTRLDVSIPTGAAYPAPSVTTSSALPAGVSLVDSGGQAALKGTPQAGSAGTYPIVITAGNAAGTATASVSLKVRKAA